MSVHLTSTKPPDQHPLPTFTEPRKKHMRFLGQMKIHSSLPLTILLVIIFITFNHSHGKQTYPTCGKQFREPKDAHLELKLPIAIAGVLCFIAASISSAGGIGGGGLFIPILTIVAAFDLKSASTFSAFMVTGGSLANILCSIFIAAPRCGGKTVIDFDIALLSEPCILLGVSIGVIFNLIFPEWFITILFATFLAWCSFKTCMSGVLFWELESEEVRRRRYGCAILENGSDQEVVNEAKLPLLSEGAGKCGFGIPWMKLGILIMVWFSFFVLYLLRGNNYGQNLLPMDPCGVGYWIISLAQIPLAIIFTAWILYRIRKESLNNHDPIGQEVEVGIKGGPSSLMFPTMALLAGILGGVFGIGGGMLISPVLLQVGIAPEVTAATCSFMVFFSSTMSSIQYMLLGMEHTSDAMIFTVICFFGSIIGLIVVQRAIEKHGRASLIVFSVGTVMVLSTVLITSFGALDIWRDYKSGNYMGFKMPC